MNQYELKYLEDAIPVYDKLFKLRGKDGTLENELVSSLESDLLGGELYTRMKFDKHDNHTSPTGADGLVHLKALFKERNSRFKEMFYHVEDLKDLKFHCDNLYQTVSESGENKRIVMMMSSSAMDGRAANFSDIQKALNSAISSISGSSASDNDIGWIDPNNEVIDLGDWLYRSHKGYIILNRVSDIKLVPVRLDRDKILTYLMRGITMLDWLLGGVYVNWVDAVTKLTKLDSLMPDERKKAFVLLDTVSSSFIKYCLSMIRGIVDITQQYITTLVVDKGSRISIQKLWRVRDTSISDSMGTRLIESGLKPIPTYRREIKKMEHRYNTFTSTEDDHKRIDELITELDIDVSSLESDGRTTKLDSYLVVKEKLHEPLWKRLSEVIIDDGVSSCEAEELTIHKSINNGHLYDQGLETSLEALADFKEYVDKGLNLLQLGMEEFIEGSPNPLELFITHVNETEIQHLPKNMSLSKGKLSPLLSVNQDDTSMIYKFSLESIEVNDMCRLMDIKETMSSIEDDYTLDGFDEVQNFITETLPYMDEVVTEVVNLTK